MNKTVDLYVYGRDVLCASCVNLPSSKDTFEWLDAALKRKYPNQPFRITYIDIEHPPENERQKNCLNEFLMMNSFIHLSLLRIRLLERAIQN